MSNDCREAFEQWANGRFDLTPYGDATADAGGLVYADAETARAFNIWQAAWEARGSQ